MSRKTARETAMKLLYQIDIGGSTPAEAVKDYYENYEGLEISADDKDYIENCVAGAFLDLKNIDNLVEKNSKEWKINRIAKVDLAIMRLAIYEMLNRNDVPKVVAVNEAIELAKKFGGDHSSNFINGILGNIIKELN